MPGYVIHLAVAQEYIKKHKKQEDYENFIKGVIYPDSVKDKSLTHYGPKSSKVNLKKFLDNNNIENSYQRGYFLHLITDYLFYNKYLDIFTKDIYNDYDILNNELIQKYNVNIPIEVKKFIFHKEGKTKILSKDLAEKVIDEVSVLDLENVKNEILENPNSEKWTKINKNII